MSQVIPIHGNALATPFAPEQTREFQAKADAMIAFATKIKDWPLIEQAIDAKIEDQKEFIRWWGDNVTVHHGAGRGKKSRDRRTFSMADAEVQTGITNQQVSRWRTRLTDEFKYRERQIQAAFRKAELAAAFNYRATGTGDNEWFTPAQYVEAARSVMGGIDLDPASNATAQQWIKADQFFTQSDDGLREQWNGRVWLNPPYAQPLIGQFVDKLLGELAASHVAQAVLLTHNHTDTAWFHAAQSIAELICFTRGRIKFVASDGERASPAQGQAFFYYGKRANAFLQLFAKFGFIVEGAV
jgi:phage N-6-adenine-methyltransferase